MNLLFENYTRRIAPAILFLCVGMFLSGCSKDKESEQVNLADRTKLTVNILGITDIKEAPSLASKASGANAEGESVDVPKKILSYAGFDAQMLVDKGVHKGAMVSIANGIKSSNASGAGLMAEAVAIDVKYRLFLYKKDGTFVSSTLLSSGTAGEVDVVKGDSYDWFAVSYNNEDDVPDMDHANPSLALPGGTDVLYASGEVTIPTGGDAINIPLAIMFSHKAAMIAIELNTMGMFADMSTAEVSVSGLAIKTGTLDLKTGALSDLTDYTQTITYDSFTDVESPYADRKVAYAYTLNEEQNDFTVTLSNLALTLDDNTTRSFADVLSASPAEFDFSVTPVAGTSYRALINLIESPLTTVNGGMTVRWARQNVYYTGGHNPYRFHHTYAHTNARNSYFSYKGIVPSNYGVDGDPCAQVYPTGVWRQASYDDLESIAGTLGLGALSPTYGSVSGSSNPVLRYVEYQQATGQAAPYPSNNLRFNFNGSSVSASLVEGLIEISLGDTYGNDADIWTSSSVVGIPGLGTGLGAWYFHGNYTPPILIGNGTYSAAMNGEILNVQVIGVDLVQTSFKNVRCVRTAGSVFP